MKYGNIKTQCSLNHNHDSKKEAAYCAELLLRKKANDILDFKVGEPIILQESFINDSGKRIRPITYTPDFIVFHEGMTEIVDVKGGKGTQTGVWKLKWKMLEFKLKGRGYKLSILA